MSFRLSVLAFCFGVCCLQIQPELPGWPVLGGLALLGLAWLVTGFRYDRWRRWRWLAFFGFGFVWAAAWAQLRMADALPEANEGRDIRVVGWVASMPQPVEQGMRFEFAVESAAAEVPGSILLGWYRARSHGETSDADDSSGVPEIRAGERWQLLVRLRRPHGNANPAGYDYEASLLERNLRATGYVRPVEPAQRLDSGAIPPRYWLEALRQQIRDRLNAYLAEAGDTPYAGVLVALAIGDQRAIAAPYWSIFARTGVTHLLSVSGLPITMVAGLLAWALSQLWRRSVWCLQRLPAQKVAAATGMLAALFYTGLSGWSVPAQRTLIMLATVALAMWFGRTSSASRVLAAALAVVLLFDPWAVLAPGFWLSFGAVGVLFFVGTGRLQAGHWLVAWGRTQWAVTIAMVPVLLAMFQQFSLVSPLANAVAIPLVSLVVTPLALLGCIPGLEFLLLPAHWLVTHLMSFLGWLAHLDLAIWQQAAPSVWSVALGLLGAVWLLLPAGFPARWLGLVMMVPMFVPAKPALTDGEVMLRVVDVGQGLAVHVRTARHNLLYDTGPRFSAESNSGNRILVPYLRAAGVGRLDGLVVSHQDKDHEGGAQAVLDSVPTDWLLASLPDEHALFAWQGPHRRCVAGDAWIWDGVRFEVLHPTAAVYSDGGHGTSSTSSNAMSCVLRISGQHASALLVGDIDSQTETVLLSRYPGELAAQVLVPAHHGSKSASSPAWVAAVRPEQVIYAAGYRNSFGHPHPDVVARYAALGARQYRTDRDGAVTAWLLADGVRVDGERALHPRYWHGR